MSDELKPCPFCGCSDVSVSATETAAYAICKGCGARGPVLGSMSLHVESRLSTGLLINNAIRAWNNRPIEDALRADATLWRDHVGQRQAVHETWAIIVDEAKTFFDDVADLRAKWDAIPWDALRSIVSQMYQPESAMTYEGLEEVENWIIFNAPKDPPK